ncbi:MAG: sugar transporter ATP-binding protein [Clostridia bacterium]|jgi:ribose transport system ATP-binding protein|nr:sugar transporter ATP-binding protein [Clostridia bacterium]
MENIVLEMRKINKSFDANHVVKDVDFNMKKGEIRALIGENGAGKSTLMNILGGVIPLDNGEIYIDNQKTEIQNPSSAKALGIAFIHQELNLINDLTVYENLFLGSEILKKSGFLDVEKMCEKTKEVLELLKINLNPKTMVKTLDASYKQVVEIAKAIMLNARIIIMDEPTTSLTNVEIENVFTIMRTLRNNGVSIIFISHKLKELISVCDSYSILRDGMLVADGNMEEDKMTEVDIARYMVNCSTQKDTSYRRREIGETILEVKNYSMEKTFSDINFSLRKGEILGFTGLLGDGRSELFQSLFGEKRGAVGTIEHKGKEISIKNTTAALNAGIGYVPSNRKENGIIKDLTIVENLTLVALNQFKRKGLLDHKRENDCTDKYKEDLRIKMGSKHNLITSLSGGNQQKIVLAKWLEANPDVLILDNPTQGVDIGGKSDIYSIIFDLAEKGISIIILSSEAQEVMRLCDRMMIMYHGFVTGELSAEEVTEEKIMILATGGSLERVN